MCAVARIFPISFLQHKRKLIKYEQVLGEYCAGHEGYASYYRYPCELCYQIGRDLANMWVKSYATVANQG